MDNFEQIIAEKQIRIELNSCETVIYIKTVIVMYCTVGLVERER